MEEIFTAIADHDGGTVRWSFNVNGAVLPIEMGPPVFDAVDNYLIDRPGYQVTITVKREPGLAASEPRLLTQEANG